MQVYLSLEITGVSIGTLTTNNRLNSYLFQKRPLLYPVLLQIRLDRKKALHVLDFSAHKQEKESLKFHQIWLLSELYQLFSPTYLIFGRLQNINIPRKHLMYATLNYLGIVGGSPVSLRLLCALDIIA